MTAKRKSRRVCITCKIEKGYLAFTSERAKVCRKCRGQRTKTSNRYRHVVTTYRISPAEYEKWIVATKDPVKGRLCQLCGQPRTGTYLPIDHDHAVEREEGMRKSLRGIICRSCNRLLRDARDSPSLLRDAADYLDAWPSRRTLLWVKGSTKDRRVGTGD